MCSWIVSVGVIQLYTKNWSNVKLKLIGQENGSTLTDGNAIEKSMAIWLILGLRPANETWRYFVTTSLIGWAQA